MSDRRARIWLAVVPTVLWLACWPFVDMAVNDDFSYAFTVKRLLETGRLTYNGWSEPIVGLQAYWALLFVWPLGFSHDALRLSVLPESIACAWLAYALHRRLGSDTRWSLFASLLLVASPLFTPWSASFMTDVPGLMFALLMFNLIVVVHQAKAANDLLRPLVLIGLVGVAGGSVRQSVLMMAGIALVIEAFRRWNDSAARARVITCTVIYATLGGALLWWRSWQPYHVETTFAPLSEWSASTMPLVRLALDGVLYCMPLIIALAPFTHISRRVRLGTLVVVSIVVGVRFALGPYSEFIIGPWAGNSVTASGLLGDELDAAGPRPVVIPPVVGMMLAILVFWALALLIQALWRRRTDLRLHFDRLSPHSSAIATLTAIGVIYVAVLIPRAGMFHVFDRYLLVVLPIVSTALLHLFRDRLPMTRPGWAAWSLLTIYALTGAAMTFDHFAELRARVAFAAQLESEGIPKNHISNGLTADAWQQLEARGYLNDWRIATPGSAFDPSRELAGRATIYWFLPFVPTIEPRWLIVNVATPQAIGPVDRSYHFRTILTPGGRWIVARSIGLPESRESDGR